MTETHRPFFEEFSLSIANAESATYYSSFLIRNVNCKVILGGVSFQKGLIALAHTPGTVNS